MPSEHQNKKVRFAIDRGGTFTDIYAEYGDSQHLVMKLLSEDPAYDDAPREGIRRILQKITGRSVDGGSLDSDLIDWVRMGTTVATNALLERKGSRTGLVTSCGFSDLLRIGQQNRPRIFDLKIEKPALLHEEVLEINERIRPARTDDQKGDFLSSVTGERYTVLSRPDPNKIEQGLQGFLDKGIRGLAVVLPHGYACPDHEILVGRIAEKLGFEQISLSSQVMPMIKMVARGDTTVVDAYLTPKIKEYLDGFLRGFQGGLEDGKLLFMQSDGGLSQPGRFRGSNAILSGPAGGVVGYAMTTFNRQSGRPVIGFDMGGTSTDVSRYGGDLELVHETETAGVRIQAPQLRINTVAAGGGSRLFFKNSMFVVGPESSGAHPGPVCYRKNGHLSVTDANLLLGRLHPGYFPNIFGPREDQPLDLAATTAAFQELTDTVNQQRPPQQPPMSPEECALGFLEVANQTMARPVREISVMRGHNIREHVLAIFGGAGGQHGCAIARMLGIDEIFIHRFSGILSAYGMGLADVVVEKQQPAAAEFTPHSQSDLLDGVQELADQARKELRDQGFAREAITTTGYLHMRYQGTDTGFMVELVHGQDVQTAFEKIHCQEFGFTLTGRPIMVDDLRVRGTGSTAQAVRRPIPAHDPEVGPDAHTSCYFTVGWQQTPVYLLEELGAGFTVEGPAMIINNTSTVLVEPASRLSITEFGDMRISLRPEEDGKSKFSTALDPVSLSIFSNLFMSVAEQMGRSLQRTAISTNIKERLDFSCALFDRKGNLVANAPHIPVHLGAMSTAVQEQIRLQGVNLRPGDVLVTNHPAAGGSHLPDITVLTPVWHDEQIIFYTAARGHHADIGGSTPGSMPPFSRSLAEEGAAILSFKLVDQGVFREKEIRELLKGARNIEDNISDLKAQIAATRKGCDLLLEMVTTYGLAVVQAYMAHIQERAEHSVRQLLKDLARSRQLQADQAIRATDFMDDGTPIRLALSISQDDGSALFDFSGTGLQVLGNWNAPKAVVSSAILYCLRCQIPDDLPMNQGCLAPITISIPPGSLLAPSTDAAVVGGNVLTSQRIVDVIFKAFGTAAASQGCMNNLTFGNDGFGYYETIGGGAGAGPGWQGQSGVHTHMTNTRITDPEILEKRFPVMLHRFSLRHGSGGEGEFCGGDGLIREIEALEDISMAILSERRVFPPYGLAGGKDGRTGENIYITKEGYSINLGSKNLVNLKAGERVVIKTPGGGGYGQKMKCQEKNKCNSR